MALRNQHAAGRLAADFAWSLRERPELLPQIARVLLDTNFESSLHEDICAEAGLDLESAETAVGKDGPTPRRDPEFRGKVLVAYEYRCAFCGYDGWLDGTMVGLDAAHVRWWAHCGPNEIANALCLCAIHHKLFDKGVLGITLQHRIVVSARFVGRGEAAVTLVQSLTGRDVIAPQKGYPRVADTYVAWHNREVFRGPARAA
jgi:putative restriction endonuclease